LIVKLLVVVLILFFGRAGEVQPDYFLEASLAVGLSAASPRFAAGFSLLSLTQSWSYGQAKWFKVV
jgi:hypothetical protein